MTRVLHFAAALAASLAALVATTSSASAAPATASRAAATVQQVDALRTASARVVKASGSFTANVELVTLVARPVGKSKCEFRVQGTLIFSGTLEGAAPGETTALIDAPCEVATTTPPGTFRDVFRFEGEFVGTVDGVAAEGPLHYAGVTRPGGAIDATIILRAPKAKATLQADAQVAVGGDYRGVALTNR